MPTTMLGRHERLKSAYRVCPQDVEDLEVVHRLLAVLNDPRAALLSVAPIVEDMPRLAARTLRMARSRAKYRRISNLAEALAAVGNQGLETVLMEYLEDLTILKADLEDAAAMDATGS